MRAGAGHGGVSVCQAGSFRSNKRAHVVSRSEQSGPSSSRPTKGQPGAVEGQGAWKLPVLPTSSQHHLLTASMPKIPSCVLLQVACFFSCTRVFFHVQFFCPPLSADCLSSGHAPTWLLTSGFHPHKCAFSFPSTIFAPPSSPGIVCKSPAHDQEATPPTVTPGRPVELMHNTKL